MWHRSGWNRGDLAVAFIASAAWARTVTRGTALGLAVVAAILVTVAPVTAGTASPAWAAAAPAATSPATAKPEHLLNDVSCVSMSDCVAVGFDYTPNRPLAEKWNGKKWALTTVRLPSGAPNGSLFTVSCPAARQCMAIGGYSTVAGYFTETWNGKAWTAGKLPTPAGTEIFITAVSCPAVNRCLAVGYWSAAGGYQTYPYAESWNGRTWTAERLPHSASTLYAYLYGVSCASVTRCVAVGTINLTTGGGSGLIAESWNGKTWSDSMPAVPPGSGTGYLYGVSCAAAASCVAVGTSGAAASPSLAEFWNGKTWKPATLPRAADGGMASVACVKPLKCVATDGDFLAPYSAAWNGKAWLVTKMPVPPVSRWTGDSGVSCPSAAGCVAVAGGGSSWLWNGRAWKLAPIA
jgi:hypothetical protein